MTKRALEALPHRYKPASEALDRAKGITIRTSSLPDGMTVASFGASGTGNIKLNSNPLPDGMTLAPTVGAGYAGQALEVPPKVISPSALDVVGDTLQRVPAAAEKIATNVVNRVRDNVEQIIMIGGPAGYLLPELVTGVLVGPAGAALVIGAVVEETLKAYGVDDDVAEIVSAIPGIVTINPGKVVEGMQAIPGVIEGVIESAGVVDFYEQTVEEVKEWMAEEPPDDK